MEQDAWHLNAGSELEADICIVGAGPAGLVLACELSRAGRRVVVLESGDQVADPVAQDLNRGTTVGDGYADLSTVRHRQVGGTAAIWNTFHHGVRGAKVIPLDPIDFEVRSWMPLSGWPFSAADLAPWVGRALTLLDLTGADFGAGEVVPGLRGTGFRPAQYQFAPAALFTERYAALAGGGADVMLLRRATATRLLRSADGQAVRAVQWASPGGGSGAVRAGTFVLAAGGIENARLLLVSGDTPAQAPGNGSGWVGAGFMEHPRDQSVRIVEPTPALTDAWRFFTLNASPGTGWGRLALTEELLRGERLRNASVTLIPEFGEPPQGVLGRLRARLQSRRPSAFRVQIQTEQAPDRANAVRLSNRTDALGVRRAELHWRWGAADEASRQRVVALFRRTVESAGWGRTIQTAEPLPDPNAHHHAGTTRMHEDPTEGVTDGQGRVHGMTNLYITGNSVFPTAGFANPTLTILALALRLAAHLGAAPGRAA